jgi:radial spoke head protein 1
LRNGTGTFIYPDGSRYEGNFLNGKRSGQGKYTYTNGDYYQGEWDNDKKHGQGIFIPNNEKESINMRDQVVV